MKISVVFVGNDVLGGPFRRKCNLASISRTAASCAEFCKKQNVGVAPLGDGRSFVSLEYTSNSPTRLRREPPREGAYISPAPKRTWGRHYVVDGKITVKQINAKLSFPTTLRVNFILSRQAYCRDLFSIFIVSQKERFVNTFLNSKIKIEPAAEIPRQRCLN